MVAAFVGSALPIQHTTASVVGRTVDASAPCRHTTIRAPIPETAVSGIKSAGGSSLCCPPTKTNGLRCAMDQASVTGGCASKLTAVAETATPMCCTTLPEALGIVAPPVPAVVCRYTGPGVCPVTCVFVPSK